MNRLFKKLLFIFVLACCFSSNITLFLTILFASFNDWSILMVFDHFHEQWIEFVLLSISSIITFIWLIKVMFDGKDYDAIIDMI